MLWKLRVLVSFHHSRPVSVMTSDVMARGVRQGQKMFPKNYNLGLSEKCRKVFFIEKS